MEHQQEQILYMKAMEEIGNRVNFAKSYFIVNPLPKDNARLNSELLALQLRLCLELFAKSQMVANINAYKEVHENFQIHWRADKIIKSIEKINPSFYPIPINEYDHSKPIRKLVTKKDDYLTKEKFIEAYDFASGNLHCRNIFDEKECDYNSDIFRLMEYFFLLVALLNDHVTYLTDNNQGWHCMVYDTDNGVTVDCYYGINRGKNPYN